MAWDIPLPDWPGVDERRIYVFLGRESYAIREPGEGWFVKTERCNLCGKCCECDENWPLGTQEIDGKLYCSHLNKSGEEWLCLADGHAPFSCNRDVPGQLPHPDCSIRYERVG